MKQMQNQITESGEQCTVLEEKQANLKSDLEDKTLKKQICMNEILVYQKLQRAYQDLKDQKYKYVSKVRV